ncbi:M20 family metallo-hydrolase [Jeotgalicoccus halotolerans]|uniref:M20 family metallo-hydrolase n=1 Tax=Jeotgalicoccus halotolerans TaxID=157227 RepID=UPI0035165E13
MSININRIKENLEHVGNTFNSGSEGYNRLAFSKEEKDAINWLEEELKNNGISVRRDSIGNLFARIGPEDKPVYAFGSHLDTVKNGGLYDGALGVMAALECLLQLKEQNSQNAAYELVCLVGEEGNPLGGTFGSRVITGQVNSDDLDDDILKAAALTKEQIKDASNTIQDYAGFIELHIEQGTVLENNGNKTGVVTNIAGIVRNHITVLGEAGHSGTMPMEYRKDALVMASEIVQHINSEVRNLDDGTVATVGQLEVRPNAATIIPGEVEMTFEVRSGNKDRLESFPEEVLNWIKENYDVKIKPGVTKPTNAMSDKIIETIEQAGAKLNLPTMRMLSGANHDTNTLAPFMDTGMIFVPSIDGISHNPAEKSDWKDIENAVNIMLETLKSLDK